MTNQPFKAAGVLHRAIAMILGVLFTIVIGAGLMGLIFYSSRRGYDDAATVESTDIGHKH